MPNIKEYLCVFHEACTVTSRRIQQGIKQTRSLLSESLKQLSPNLTSLVPEKCQGNTNHQSQQLGTWASSEAGSTLAWFQHLEPVLRPT